MPQLYVKKFYLYFLKTYIGILQMSSKDLEWWANIHGVKEHEVGGDWKGGDLLWAHLEARSWFTSTNHR